MQSKFASLEDRLRAEITEATRSQEKMTLDINNEVPFVRQGSGRRPGPRKFIHSKNLHISVCSCVCMYVCVCVSVCICVLKQKKKTSDLTSKHFKVGN